MIRAAIDFTTLARTLTMQAQALAKARAASLRAGSTRAWRDARLLWPLSTRE